MRRAASNTSPGDLIARSTNISGLATGKVKPPTPEEAQELLEQAGGDWFYGKGLGSTMITVGACVAFPPYAIYVLGNAGLTMAGYEGLYVTDALPEETRDGVREGYGHIASIPGRVTSAVADEEFRDK